MLGESPRDHSFLLALLFTSILWFISVLCWRDEPALRAALAADNRQGFGSGEYWRFWTAIAVHHDGIHLLSNSALFVPLAYLLYGYFGLSVFPVGTLLLGGVVNMASVLSYSPQPVRLIGASGVVYLMAGFWITMYLLVERRLRFGKRLSRMVGVGLLVLLPSAADPSVSYRTHWIGLAAGCLWALSYFLVHREEIRAAETVRVIPDEAEGEEW